jgi:hypothetical protein
VNILHPSIKSAQPPAVVLFAALLLTSGAGLAAPPPAEATPQRPTFSKGNSTTAPGTVELELGGGGNGEFFGLPTTFKFTPAVSEGLFSGMEFSVGFDSISSFEIGNSRDTRFGDRIGFAARRSLYENGGFSFGLAPQAVFFLRDEEGARLGGSAIAVYSFGRNALVTNLIWTAATDSSENNPARQTSIIAGYSRTLGDGPRSSRAAAFAEFLQEFPSGQPSRVSLLQGVSYRLRPDLVLDFALQQNGLAATPFDLVFATGLTYNLGRFF